MLWRFALPDVYARNLIFARMAPRWDRWKDQFRHAGRYGWPGIPTPAIIGLTANSVTEREVSTAGEIGLFQTMPEAWDRLRTDPLVQRICGGRPAVARSGAWQTAIIDQCAVGVVDYARNAQRVAAALPEGVRPVNFGSQWAYACGVAGYVIGAGGAASMLRRYAQPSTGDASAFSVVLASAATGSALIDRSTGHALVRTMQRLACGRELHHLVGDFQGQSAGHTTELGAMGWENAAGRPGVPGMRGGWPVNLAQVSMSNPLERRPPILPWDDERDSGFYRLTIPDGTTERITAAYYPDGAPASALRPVAGAYGIDTTTASSSPASRNVGLVLGAGAGVGLGWLWLRSRRRRA